MPLAPLFMLIAIAAAGLPTATAQPKDADPPIAHADRLSSMEVGQTRRYFIDEQVRTLVNLTPDGPQLTTDQRWACGEFIATATERTPDSLDVEIRVNAATAFSAFHMTGTVLFELPSDYNPTETMRLRITSQEGAVATELLNELPKKPTNAPSAWVSQCRGFVSPAWNCEAILGPPISIDSAQPGDTLVVPMLGEAGWAEFVVPVRWTVAKAKGPTPIGAQNFIVLDFERAGDAVPTPGSDFADLLQRAKGRAIEGDIPRLELMTLQGRAIWNKDTNELMAMSRTCVFPNWKGDPHTSQEFVTQIVRGR